MAICICLRMAVQGLDNYVMSMCQCYATSANLSWIGLFCIEYLLYGRMYIVLPPYVHKEGFVGLDSRERLQIQYSEWHGSKRLIAVHP